MSRIDKLNLERYTQNLKAYVDSRAKSQPSGDATIVVFNITEAETTIELKNLDGLTRIDWGDGEINSQLSHTYTAIGKYVCKIYGVTSFGLNAFNACSALKSIEFAANVITIGDRSFRNCTNLERVVLGLNIQSIIFGAFFRDAKLRSIVIPENCSTIGAQAFDSCTNLTIYCEVESKPDGWDANWNKSNCPVVWGYQDQDYPELVTAIRKLEMELAELKRSAKQESLE